MNTDEDKISSRLRHMPISFFAVVMGLCGLTLAWEKAEQASVLPFHASPYIALITAVVFVGFLGFYVAKCFLHLDAVKAELHHPVRLSFFPATSISLLLLSLIAFEYDTQISKVMWMVGAAAHLGLTLYVLSAWINHTHFEIHHMNPAWFIPVVGNIVAPIGGIMHGFVDTSWFFFSIGFVFWLVLMVIAFYRIIFHNPLPDKLLPTFFILIAPPAVGFLSYVKLTGGIDPMAMILYNTALFLTLMLASQFMTFLRLKFFLSWWAYSFPLAAMTMATFVMAQLSGKDWYHTLAVVLFAILNIVLVILLVRTAQAMLNNKICVAED